MKSKGGRVKVDAAMVGKVYGKCHCGANLFLCSSMLNYYTVCAKSHTTIIVAR